MADVERVQKLLAGELLDTSRIAYDFDAHHVALVGEGSEAGDAIDEVAEAAKLPALRVVAEGMTWAWFGSQNGFSLDELNHLTSLRGVGGERFAVGEPARGLAGWRLTHRQARAAFAVARRGSDTVVHYADVAVLATVLRDDLLATSLHQIYIEPLEAARDGGAELSRTLSAYFAADRNVSLAGAELGVSRQAVARRLRAAEERIGRSIPSCGPELEVALRFKALDDLGGSAWVKRRARRPGS